MSGRVTRQHKKQNGGGCVDEKNFKRYNVNVLFEEIEKKCINPKTLDLSYLHVKLKKKKYITDVSTLYS